MNQKPQECVQYFIARRKRQYKKFCDDYRSLWAFFIELQQPKKPQSKLIFLFIRRSSRFSAVLRKLKKCTGQRLDVIRYQKPSLELTVGTKFPVEKSFIERKNKNKNRTS